MALPKVFSLRGSSAEKKAPNTGRPPPPAHGGGGWSAAGLGRTEGGGGTATSARGERRGGERERGCAGKTKTKSTMPTMEVGHRGIRSSPEPNTNSSIKDEPSVRLLNQRHCDEKNVAVPSDSADDARIESNLLARVVTGVGTVPNFSEQFRKFRIESKGGVLNFGKGLMRGFQPYILLGFEDILFFIIILFLTLKFIFRKRLKSFLISEKYLEGSKISKKIP
jgi:hypothetical protein